MFQILGYRCRLWPRKTNLIRSSRTRMIDRTEARQKCYVQVWRSDHATIWCLSRACKILSKSRSQHKWDQSCLTGYKGSAQRSASVERHTSSPSSSWTCTWLRSSSRGPPYNSSVSRLSSSPWRLRRSSIRVCRALCDMPGELSPVLRFWQRSRTCWWPLDGV